MAQRDDPTHPGHIHTSKLTSGLVMTRFSLLYGSRGEPEADSPRMRRRLFAFFSTVEDRKLASIIEQELGVKVAPIGGYDSSGYRWEKFFTEAELRDVLDVVSLHYRLLNRTSRQSSARSWRDGVRRILTEENLYYRVDDDGIVHFSVDEEFERARQGSIAALQAPRYANALAAFERAYRELDQTPPDGKEAIRATFAALEGLFRLMFERANRLGSDEVQTHLVPYLEQRYAGEKPALLVAQKLARAFKDWVTGAHFYRHEQGQEDVVQPPLGLAIAVVSAGAAYLRWLADLDQDKL